MSVLKQMEEARLSPEEVQEIIELLDSQLPKIKNRVDEQAKFSTLANNLKDSILKHGAEGIVIPEIKPTLANGFKLLTSAKSKLEKFIELIKDL